MLPRKLNHRGHIFTDPDVYNAQRSTGLQQYVYNMYAQFLFCADSVPPLNSVTRINICETAAVYGLPYQCMLQSKFQRRHLW